MNEIKIYEQIGAWGVSHKTISDELSGMVGDVTVRVNSPGGDVYAGLGIMNALRGHDGVITAIVEGECSSAASFIVAGGADVVIARPHSEFMVHDAWSELAGNAGDHEKAAVDLNRLSGALAEIYAGKTGESADVWRERMRAETWYSAREALAVGLVDRIEDARDAVESRSREPDVSGARVAMRFKYPGGRASAPAPKISEGEPMSMMKNLAEEMGVSEVSLRAVLMGKVAMSDAVVASDASDDAVSAAGVAEQESEGAVETAADAVENATGETASEVEEETEDEESEGTETPAGKSKLDELVASGEAVVIPKEEWERMQAELAENQSVLAERAAARRKERVDADIKAGRFNPANRSKALECLERDPAAYEVSWGAMPVNSMNVKERGSAKAVAAEGVNALLELAEKRRKNGVKNV